MILNLTQHSATSEQVAAGVLDLALVHEKELLKELLTFETIPTEQDMRIRAGKIAFLARDYGANKAMIGGAPFFMSALEIALLDAGVQPIYAFSKREVTEKDGVKTSVFHHLGFVEVAGID